MIAALFVEKDGPYSRVNNCDVYDVTRDARMYHDRLPVVAHPPCERWGRYATGGPNPSAKRYAIGDDGGCFATALANVRRVGGVLEHPEASHAWATFGLARPPRDGGWVRADAYGFTCCVAQGFYGHRARKLTWLYAVDCVLPALAWGVPTGMTRIDLGPKSKAHADALRLLGQGAISKLSFTERVHTPEPFRNMLVAMARSVPFVRSVI